MPDWAIYINIAKRFPGTTPWQIEQELTLEWFNRLMVWIEEQPEKTSE